MIEETYVDVLNIEIREKKKKRMMLIGIILTAIAMVVITIVVCVLVFKKKDEKDEAKKPEDQPPVVKPIITPTTDPTVTPTTDPGQRTPLTGKNFDSLLEELNKDHVFTSLVAKKDEIKNDLVQTVSNKYLDQGQEMVALEFNIDLLKIWMKGGKIPTMEQYDIKYFMKYDENTYKDLWTKSSHQIPHLFPDMTQSKANPNKVILPTVATFLFKTNTATTMPIATKLIQTFNGVAIHRVQTELTDYAKRDLVFKCVRVLKFGVHLGETNVLLEKNKLVHNLGLDVFKNDIFKKYTDSGQGIGLAIKDLMSYQPQEKKWECLE